MTRNKILEEAWIPEIEWELCYIDADGLIYRPIYNRITRELLETGKEYYDRYIIERDKPIEIPPDEMEVLKKENKQLWDTVELLLKVNGFLPSEDPIYQIKG